MSSNEDRHGGIPTRAIHEAYLDMQRALKRYRQATDQGHGSEWQQAHGDVQETVLTFYELLRPHIKHNEAVSDYWDGEPPSYPGNGAPDPEEGEGVIQVQTRTETQPITRDMTDEASFEEMAEWDLRDWHESLNLNGEVRLRSVHADTTEEGQPYVFVQYDSYQLGLRTLDDWQTRFRTKQTELGGFVGGTTQTETERQRVAMPKLKRAARELSEVAERLGALSEFDASTPRTEITEEDMEKVERWRQQNLDK